MADKLDEAFDGLRAALSAQRLNERNVDAELWEHGLEVVEQYVRATVRIADALERLSRNTSTGIEKSLAIEPLAD